METPLTPPFTTRSKVGVSHTTPPWSWWGFGLSSFSLCHPADSRKKKAWPLIVIIFFLPADKKETVCYDYDTISENYISTSGRHFSGSPFCFFFSLVLSHMLRNFLKVLEVILLHQQLISLSESSAASPCRNYIRIKELSFADESGVRFNDWV